jgi:hypothetical protein
MTNAWSLHASRPKLPPGALMALADDLLADVFTEWILMEDVCRLDSAVCAKMWRPGYLRLVSTKVLLFLREDINVLDYRTKIHRTLGAAAELTTTMIHRTLGAAELTWILKRGVHLASLCLAGFIEKINGRSKEEENIRAAVAALLSQGRLDKLETILFYGCHYMKDIDLTNILTKSYKSIKVIDIQACRGITVSLLAAHIKRCTVLEAFTARGNESTSDMVEIIQSCRKLRKLPLSQFGDRLTDEVVQSVANHCRFLATLDLGGCTILRFLMQPSGEWSRHARCYNLLA